MNLNLIARITLSTLVTSFTALITTTSASAFSFTLSGTFDDSGTIEGTFDYDESTEEYSNIDLTTTSGNVVSTGSNYTNANAAFLTSNSSDGFAIEVSDGTDDFILDLTFESSLAALTPTETTQLSSSSYEENFSDGSLRYIASGSVTAVPFEFSPSLGLLLVGGVWGIHRLKKIRNNIK